MKKRVTYLGDGETVFDPKQLLLSRDALTVSNIHGSREERITFDLDELPTELVHVLEMCRELHMRWSREEPYDISGPFSSRISPGLHILYRPKGEDQDQAEICILLRQMFGDSLGCRSPESFIDFDLASSHSGSEPSLLQFYQVLPSLKQFVDYTQRILCSKGDMVCDEFASSVSFVDSLDLDYDVRSRSFSILGYQSQSPNISQQVGWSETIHGNPAKAHRVEIGVLSMQSPMEKGKLTVGGFLAVVGENEEPKPTLFSFPARYHPLPRKYRYSASFIEPTGLHPTLQLSISQSSLTRPPAPPEFTCSLHTYLNLPSAIFADKYQLSTADPLFFHSNNLLALNSITGETDLEAPVWTLNRWGSNVLVELPQTLLTPTFGSLNATIPLHLRYQSPSPTGHKTIQVPWPVVFWACTPDRGPKKAISPFDRTSLEYDSFFRRSTRFYMLNPDPQSGHSLVETVQVPVLAKDLSPGSGYFTRQSVSEALIIATVLVGFFFVLYKLDVVARRFRIRGNLSPRLSERKRD